MTFSKKPNLSEYIYPIDNKDEHDKNNSNRYNK